MTVAPHAALADCEALVLGPFGVWQPVNTVSSLAFVAAGMWLLRESAGQPAVRRRVVLGLSAALVAVGLGSAAFHAPGTAGAHRVHDLSIVALLLVVLAGGVADASGDERVLALVPAALAGMVVVFALAPGVLAPAGAALAVLVVAAEALALRSRPLGRAGSGAYRLALAALAVGAVLHALARTGGAWCRPESLLQGHALWHLAAALAVAAWGSALLRQPERVPTAP